MYLLAADFLNIMSAYEKAVQETFAVADLWRQYYQDEETVKALVRASLRLAHVGEMKLKAALRRWHLFYASMQQNCFRLMMPNKLLMK